MKKIIIKNCKCLLINIVISYIFFSLILGNKSDNNKLLDHSSQNKHKIMLNNKKHCLRKQIQIKTPIDFTVNDSKQNYPFTNHINKYKNKNMHNNDIHIIDGNYRKFKNYGNNYHTNKFKPDNQFINQNYKQYPSNHYFNNYDNNNSPKKSIKNNIVNTPYNSRKYYNNFKPINNYNKIINNNQNTKKSNYKLNKIDDLYKIANSININDKLKRAKIICQETKSNFKLLYNLLYK